MKKNNGKKLFFIFISCVCVLRGAVLHTVFQPPLDLKSFFKALENKEWHKATVYTQDVVYFCYSLSVQTNYIKLCAPFVSFLVEHNVSSAHELIRFLLKAHTIFSCYRHLPLINQEQKKNILAKAYYVNNRAAIELLQ